jgi:uncharacterized protein YbjT (DUF2867 family)
MKLIVTGATGMVGEGVLYECLTHPDIEAILIVGRKKCGIVHPKLTEIIHDNFYDLSPVKEHLKDYSGCLFCLGVTSIGKKEPEYYSLTYTLTMRFAETLAGLNPDMTFCYISGAGTDSTEKGKIMWARVKGKTENDLMKLPFKRVYNFRPGFLQPAKGAKNIHGFNFMYTLFYPFLRAIAPSFVSTIQELGSAMIKTVIIGYDKSILEVRDIVSLAQKQ